MATTVAADSTSQPSWWDRFSQGASNFFKSLETSPAAPGSVGFASGQLASLVGQLNGGYDPTSPTNPPTTGSGLGQMVETGISGGVAILALGLVLMLVVRK